MLEHIVSNDAKVKQGFEDKDLDQRKIKNMIDPKLEEIVSCKYACYVM